MEKVLRWLNLLLVVVTFIAYASPYINPSHIWFFSIIGMAYPWLLLFNLCFIFGWLLTKKWYFLFSVGCILMGWNHFQSFVGINNSTSALEKELTVMSFNAMSYYKMKGDILESFSQTLAQLNPDIICMQEAFSRTSPINKKTYPYVFQPKNKKLLIYSKYPFANSGNLNMGNTSNGCTFVDLKFNKQIIRIYNIHLQSNRVSSDASKLREEGDLQEADTWVDVGTMLKKVRRAAIIRTEQAEKILNHTKSTSSPIIICGDMNETPLSYPYRLFSNKLKDGFKEKGVGIGTTYNGVIPLLRIDYIWVDNQLRINDYSVIKKNFSDHFPVVSRIQLN